jgi:hypothetical protein
LAGRPVFDGRNLELSDHPPPLGPYAPKLSSSLSLSLTIP